ncbi:subtilisin AprE [Streptomyces pseudoechinosporeus]
MVPPAGARAEVTAQPREKMGRYVVVLRDSVADVGAVVRKHGIRYGLLPRFVYRHALEGYSAAVPKNRVRELRNDPDVAAVATDLPVRASRQTLPTGVDRVEGDHSSTRSGDGMGTVNAGVAVLDTGIDQLNSDLNVAGGVNCTLPLRLTLPLPAPGLSSQDDHGHGTHVAGTIAARDNSRGAVGVAPGARLYAVKVLNAAGSGFTSNIVCGIDWVAKNAQAKNITVANMSLGGSGSDDGNCGNTNDDPMHMAICRAVDQAGVTFAVAAGNDAANYANTVPAAYNEVLTATAMADFNGRPGGGASPTCRRDEDDSAADFSNFTTKGSADVEHTIAAPGVCIESTALGGDTRVLSGTSMASPHMAGIAALCIIRPQSQGGCAGKTPAQVISKLRADAAAQPDSYGFAGDPDNPNGNRYYGHLGYAGAY